MGITVGEVADSFVSMSDGDLPAADTPAMKYRERYMHYKAGGGDPYCYRP